MKTAVGTGKVSYFGLIQKAFEGGVEVKNEPQEEVDEGLPVIGIITDPVIRSLYSQAVGLDRDISEVIKSHNALHTAGEIHDPSVCAMVHAQCEGMTASRNLFFNLFCYGVDALSQSANLVGIRKGWQMVNLDQPVGYEPIFSEVMHPSNTLFADVRRAFLAKDEHELELGGITFRPIDQEAEESILGHITNPVIKALYLVRKGLGDAVKSLKRELVCVVAGESTTSTLEKMVSRAQRLEKQCDIVDNLFWLAVRETLALSGDDHRVIGLRENWTVVHVPQDESFEDDIVDMLQSLLTR